MSGGPGLQRWWSGHGGRIAAEWCPQPGAVTFTERAMAELASATGDAAFLVVPLRCIAAHRLVAAIEAFRTAGGTARICISGGRADLARIDSAVIDNDYAGLMLDDVNAGTPLSDLIWEGIEAVRFSNDFVVQASRHLRLGYALESMLGLARDLGLCTLGVQAQPGGACVSDSTSFDYLPVSDAKPVRPAHRTRINEPVSSLGR